MKNICKVIIFSSLSLTSTMLFACNKNKETYEDGMRRGLEESLVRFGNELNLSSGYVFVDKIQTAKYVWNDMKYDKSYWISPMYDDNFCEIKSSNNKKIGIGIKRAAFLKEPKKIKMSLNGEIKFELEPCSLTKEVEVTIPDYKDCLLYLLLNLNGYSDWSITESGKLRFHAYNDYEWNGGMSVIQTQLDLADNCFTYTKVHNEYFMNSNHKIELSSSEIKTINYNFGANHIISGLSQGTVNLKENSINKELLDSTEKTAVDYFSKLNDLFKEKNDGSYVTELSWNDILLY